MSKTSIIAHRGAFGYFPEHTIAGYSLALELGSDYIEPDLVLSKDNVFFAFHDILLDEISNIKEIENLKERKSIKLVDGEEVTGYFICDFTAKELKQIKIRQRYTTTRSHYFDYLYEIPTLSEMVETVRSYYNPFQRPVGIYLELKNPSFYLSQNFSMDSLILSYLTSYGFDIHNVRSDLSNGYVAPIVIECFEYETLMKLRSQCDLPLIQLVNTQNEQKISDLWTKSNLDFVMQYANGIGPPIYFFNNFSLINFITAKEMMDDVRSRGLVIHPWELRNEPIFVSPQFNGNSTLEAMYFICCLEVEGIFTDFPDKTKSVVELVYQNNKICNNICPEKFFNYSDINNNNDNNNNNNNNKDINNNSNSSDNIILFGLFALCSFTFLYLFKKFRKYYGDNRNIISTYRFVSDANIDDDI